MLAATAVGTTVIVRTEKERGRRAVRSGQRPEQASAHDHEACPCACPLSPFSRRKLIKLIVLIGYS